MLELAETVGVFDPLEREREELGRAKRRQERAAALFAGASFATLFFVAWIGVTA